MDAPSVTPVKEDKLVFRREPAPYILKKQVSSNGPRLSTNRGQISEKKAVSSKLVSLSETESDNTSLKSKIFQKSSRKPSSSQAYGARKLDSEMFLSKDEYINDFVDKTLLIKMDNYDFIKNIIKKENDSFLESRVEEMYEIQLHTTETKWNSITQEINEKYQMKKNSVSGMEIFEIINK